MGLDLPINLDVHLFDKNNTWVLIGLPDNQQQHDASLARSGFGSQISWMRFSETVVFGNRKFEVGHPLSGARDVEPELSASGKLVFRADKYPCYDLRRNQLIYLRNLGMRVKLGATSEDFLSSANEAFAEGGLLSVLAHFEDVRGFEFNDGFLSVEDIPKRRVPSGFGLLDVAACRTGELLRRIKMNFGPSTFAYAPNKKISVTGALIKRILLYTSILYDPRTFEQHLNRAEKWLP